MMNKILHIIDYFDQPVEGISETDRGNYYFRRSFSEEKDNYEDVYFLYSLEQLGVEVTAFEGGEKDVSNVLSQIDSLIADSKVSSLLAEPQFRCEKSGPDGLFYVSWVWR